MAKYLKLGCLVGLFAVAGCGLHSITETTLSNGIKMKVVTPMGEGSNSRTEKTTTGEEEVAWNSDGLKITLKELRLKVNGNDYGAVKSGDSVVVDSRKEVNVTVNGGQRKPEPTP